MSAETHPPSEPEARPPEEQETPARGRQIVVIFLVIALISIAVMQFHTLVPGMDQFVGVTPVVLAIVVVATIWLLLRTARRH